MGTCISSPETRMLAASASGDLVTVKALLNRQKNMRRVNMGFRNEEGYTALHLAAAAGHVAVVEALLERGVTAAPTTDAGYTPLMLAAKAGHLDVCRVLGPATKAVKALESTDLSYANTALCWAAQCAPAETVAYLCQLGCSKEARSRYARATPLMLAADVDALDIVKVLLAAGANPHTKDSNGLTALARARLRESKQVGDLLERAMSSPPPDSPVVTGGSEKRRRSSSLRSSSMSY